jgi:phosphoribulokinase
MTTKNKPVIIGIVGDSAVGKTTLAAGIAEALGSERTIQICIDDYHRYSRADRLAKGLTPQDPAANHMDILEQHIDLLRHGEPVLKPVYDHDGGVLRPPEYVEPKPFIILEGLLGYATAALRNVYDLKFYLEPQESLRLRWKFQRDMRPGRYSREQIMTSLDQLKRDSEAHVLPQRGFADMIVSFSPPENDPEATGAGLNVRHILRPTLPYVDLAPVLETGADKGVELELARDVDGKPVDSLNILGSVNGVQAEAMQNFLWGLISETSIPRPHLGRYRDADAAWQVSAPLALSQLMITHYLLTAEAGTDDA